MKLVRVAALAAALFGGAGAAHAVVYNEVGDAGDLPATAQQIGAGVDQIAGTYAFYEVDMYGFAWGGGALTITSPEVSETPFLDPVLMLFDSNGLGIALNDDESLSDLSAKLDFANLAAGDYFLAFTYCCRNALSADGEILDGVFGTGQFGANGAGGGKPVIGYQFLQDVELENVYVINFSSPTAGAAVPEPASLALLGTSLLGLGWLRRRR